MSGALPGTKDRAGESTSDPARENPSMATTQPHIKDVTTTDHPLAEYAADEKTVKRARWEHLRLAACPGANRVNVCNLSYGVQAKADHTHTVAVRHGMPTECTCKSFEYRSGFCKHMLAVADKPYAIDAAEGNAQ
jgi:hypothetical protein